MLSDFTRDARENNKTVKIADILTLCGEKFSELPEEFRKLNAPELWLDSWHRQFKRGDRVVVKLRTSLYGHPLAGKLWEEHLSARLKELGGTELQSYPSNWIFARKGQVLLLCVYVDDLVLAGPRDYTMTLGRS